MQQQRSRPVAFQIMAVALMSLFLGRRKTALRVAGHCSSHFFIRQRAAGHDIVSRLFLPKIVFEAAMRAPPRFKTKESSVIVYGGFTLASTTPRFHCTILHYGSKMERPDSMPRFQEISQLTLPRFVVHVSSGSLMSACPAAYISAERLMKTFWRAFHNE